MPKVVDHEARRVEVYEAVWRVIARVGLRATTTRAIATEAGLSLGALNYYFPNKDELLIRAHEMGFTRARDRILTTGVGLRGLAALRHALYGSLPLDAERLVEAHVDIAFCAEALTNPRLAAVRLESHREMRDLLAVCLDEARAAGEIGTDGSTDQIVDEFILLVDGGSIAGLLYGEPADMERRLTQRADAFIARLATSR